MESKDTKTNIVSQNLPEIKTMNINNIPNQIINAMVASYVMKLMQSNNKFTYKTVAYLLLIISLDELKKIMIDVIQFTKKKITEGRTNFPNILMYFCELLSKLLYQKKNNHVKKPIYNSCPKDYDIKLKFHLSSNIREVIFSNFEKTSSNHNLIPLDTKYLNFNEKQKSYLIENINIDIPKLGKIKLPSIIAEKNYLDKTLNSVSYKINESEPLIGSIPALKLINLTKSLTDDDDYYFCKDDKITLKPFNGVNYELFNHNMFGDYNDFVTCKITMFIIKVIGFPSINLKQKNFCDEISEKLLISKPSQLYFFFVQIFNIVHCACDIYSQLKIKPNVLLKYMLHMLKNHNLFCLPGVWCCNYESDKYIDLLKCSEVKDYKYDSSRRCKTYHELKNLFPTLDDFISLTEINIQLLHLEQFRDTNKKPSNSTNNIELKIKLNDKKISDIDAGNIIEEYFENIIKKEGNRKKKQSIFVFKKIEKTEEKILENPEYAKYINKKSRIEKILENVSTESKKENVENNGFYKELKLELIKLEEPDKEISKQIVTSSFVKNFVRHINKPLDTLYLRQDDKENLIDMLDSFKNGKHIFEEFGINHKLGFLVHGLPGTGKTSTILAIAHYLEVDIFYIELNNIKKNSELKEMFDYVQSQNINGGMIVFEDIDAMTPVVLKRSEDIDVTNTRLTLLDDDGDLNLSYLLNLLDGTLCSDNTIFGISTNHKNKLDPALYREGRIDVDIEFKLCDKYQINCIFKRIIGRDLDPKVLELIEEDKYTPANLITHLHPYYFKKHFSDREIMKKFIQK